MEGIIIEVGMAKHAQKVLIGYKKGSLSVVLSIRTDKAGGH
jgi:hypothetical protein